MLNFSQNLNQFELKILILNKHMKENLLIFSILRKGFEYKEIGIARGTLMVAVLHTHYTL